MEVQVSLQIPANICSTPPLMVLTTNAWQKNNNLRHTHMAAEYGKEVTQSSVR